MRGYLKTPGWVFKLQPKTTVGRHEDSDLCLQNGGVEERHALIELSEPERCFVLRDLNSTHGTFVNECRIHNASVRLSPGDELHFGFGGPTYQLAVDSASPSQLSCPPVHQRLAWQNPLQVIEGSSAAPPGTSPLSQLPVLPGQPSTRSSWVQGGPPATPRPPSRARPVSAGAKRPGTAGRPTDHGVPSLRPGSFNCSGTSGTVQSLRNAATVQSSQTLSHLLQEKEERLLRLGDEISRLTVFEGESRRKDGVIAGLRDEVSALRHQLTQNQADPEVRNRLRDLERDINDKKEQIEGLKTQMLQLQKNSSEEFKHSVCERDLKISSLRSQLEKLKKENGMSSGLVTSLQRDLSSREKQSQKLAAEVDKLRQDIRHKDAQLVSLSSKLSKVKENQSHQEELQARENEAGALRKQPSASTRTSMRVEKLERTLVERRTELLRLTGERDSLKNQLEAEQQRRLSVQAEVDSGRQQLQESRQREQRSRVELERVQTRLERFRSNIIQSAYSDPGVSAPEDSLSDLQVIEQITELLEEKEAAVTRLREVREELSGEREELRARLQELEEQAAATAEEQGRVTEEEQGFRNSLEECQCRLQEALSVTTLQQEISTLQEQSVPQSLTWVQSVAHSLLAAQLSQLQEVSLALQDAGTEEPDSAGGAAAAIRALWHQSQEREEEFSALQGELKEVRDALEQSQGEQARAVEEQLSHLREELEQERQQAQKAVHEEEDGLKLQLEEMRKEMESVKSLENSLREEARAKEAELHQLLVDAERKGAEQEKECYRVREAEYREHIRQHALTIVDKDQRLTHAAHRVRNIEEERDCLREQLRELKTKLEGKEADSAPVPAPVSSTPDKAADVVALEETVSLLRTSLAESRQESVAQGDVIAALTRDLAAANAKMSDMTGELSEQRKVELEQHQALVVDQRVQLSTLTDKLSQMSWLVDRKGEELQSMREELRQCQEELQRRDLAERERREMSPPPLQPPALPQDVAAMTAAAELAELGSKCVDHRHEEVIQRQQEALVELRLMVKALEQAAPTMASPELCIQQVALMKRELSELRAQRTALCRGDTDSMIGNSLPGSVSVEMLEHTARPNLSDALDLSEETYLELARALSEALDLGDTQLPGSASLKHLPVEERERLGVLRQRDLELLRTRLSLLQSQGQRREQLLQEYQRDLSASKDSQAASQLLQVRLDSLREELQAECQESSLLREALQQTQARLEQEINLNRAIKERKALSLDWLEKRISRVPSHSCVKEDVGDKAESRKTSLQEKLKRREYEIEVLKKQLRNSASHRPSSAQQTP